MQYYSPSYPMYRKDDGRGLLLPLLVGAAVGFPFGYIASNTSKNNNQMPYYYPQPLPYMQQVPYMQPIPYMQQSPYPMGPQPYFPY